MWQRIPDGASPRRKPFRGSARSYHSRDHHCTITVPSPHHHHTTTVPSPYHHRTITAPSLHHHCNITVPSPVIAHILNHHRSITASSLCAALAAGASINYQDERGFTPLCAAYVHRHVHVLRLLLDSGADPVVRVPVVEEQDRRREESTTSGGLLRCCRPCRDMRDDNEEEEEEVEVAAEEDCCYLCRRNGRDMIGYMNGDMPSSSRHFNGSTCAECENKLRCHEPGTITAPSLHHHRTITVRMCLQRPPQHPAHAHHDRYQH